MQQQGEAPASLAIGTSVSAKYKGAFCEAKVKSVVKQVKCRVTFKHGLGSTTISDEYIKSDRPLQPGLVVLARHPDKQDFLEATINKIQDQSQYTVVFDDGDITTLRRNALCMKSGKHFSASESLDNLPLTHPEHFSTPVGGGGVSGIGASGKRRRRRLQGQQTTASSDADDDSSSEENHPDEGNGGSSSGITSSYLANVGRVVCVENSDKKGKSWFPALIVAPAASASVKIDTKEEFLIRSFKDGRYYTVSKKDTTKFHRDVVKKAENSHLKSAMDKAVLYIEKGELPPHWDKETLFKMGDDSTTESSETESVDDDEDDEPPEEKDYLVAELYKHMEDRGQPINKTPSIGNKDVDLYRLFKLVSKRGGHNRVSHNGLWRNVALKLGFETTWCINQVRVHYMRYLSSFEELHKTLGCTMRHHPRRREYSGSNASSTASSHRSVIRGKHRLGTLQSKSEGASAESAESDKSSIGSSAADEKMPDPCDSKSDSKSSVEKKKLDEESENINVDVEDTPSASKRMKLSKEGRGSKVKKDESKISTRPRRDSTSSLAAAMQVKEKKETLSGSEESSRKSGPRDKDNENESKKIQSTKNVTKIVKEEIFLTEKDVKLGEKKAGNGNNERGPFKRKLEKKKGKVGNTEDIPDDPIAKEVGDEKQHLAPNVDVYVGDKLKVFYKLNTIYEAKVIKVQERSNEKFPRYLVHYQGWNARYDEWIKRSRIAENLSWSKDREKNKSMSTGESGSSSISSQLSTNLDAASKKEGKPPRKDDKKDVTTAVKDKTVPQRGKAKNARTGGDGSQHTFEKSDTPSSSRSGSRTGSPAALKRQTSRSSMKKDSESEEESDDVRKSARLQKSSTSGSVGSRGSSRKRQIKEESETDETSDYVLEKTPLKSKRGRKSATPSKETELSDSRVSTEAAPSSPIAAPQGTPSSRPKRSTPSRECRTSTRKQQQQQQTSTKGKSRRQLNPPEDEDDPYAFKEPEPFEEGPKSSGSGSAPQIGISASSSSTSKLPGNNSKKSKETSSSEDTSTDEESKRNAAQSVSSETPEGSEQDKARVKRESDSNDSSSSLSEDQNKKSSRNIRSSSKLKEKLEEPCEKEEPIKEEEKPLDLLGEGHEVETCKTTQVKEETVDTSEHAQNIEVKKEEDKPPQNEGKTLLQMSKKQRELFPFLSAIRSKEDINKTASITTVQSSLTIASGNDDKSGGVSGKQKPSKKRKTPKKPSSSEIVESESESDSNKSEDEKGNSSDVKLESKDSKDIKVREVQEEDVEEKKVTSVKKDDQDDLDLACGETIPGSPDPSSSALEMSHSSMNKSITGTTSSRLEMPFASVPTSVSGQDTISSSNKQMSSVRRPPPPETPDDDEDTKDSYMSRVARDNGDDESSEVDLESLSGRLKAGSEDSNSTTTNNRMMLDADKDESQDKMQAGRSRSAGGSKRRPAQSSSPAPTNNKRRRRPREAALRGRGSRGRHSTYARGYGFGYGRNGGYETDDGGEDGNSSGAAASKDPTIASIGALDNEALLALCKKTTKSSKYNFIVDLETSMDSTQRISKIQKSLEELRKTYNSVKSELAVLERRRKKIKKKEREKSEKESSSASSSGGGGGNSNSMNNQGSSAPNAPSSNPVEAAA